MNTLVTIEAKKIKINNIRLLLWPATYFMVCFLACYGEREIFLCLCSMSIMLFIVFCSIRLNFFVMKRIAGEFYFNDEEQKIITKRKDAIPYNKVKIIKILKTSYILRIDAILPGFIGRKIPLLFTDTQDEERIIPEIKKRFKNGKIKIRRFSVKKQTPIIMAIIILLVLLPIVHLYQKYPQLNIYPKQYVQEREVNDLKEINTYILNGFNFNLPKGFLQKEGENFKYEFSSEDQETAILVSNRAVVDEVKKEKRFSKFFFALAGIKDDYDLFRSIYHNRIGYLALVAKAIILAAGGEAVEIYEINKNIFRGLLVFKKQNKEQGKIVADLFLVDKKAHNRISFVIISQNKIDYKLLDIIINGISVRKE